MKKILYLLICVLLCFISGCASRKVVDMDKDEQREIVDSGKYYCIYQEYITRVSYEIYDSQGKVALSETTDRPLKISMVNDDILDISIGLGTGIVSHQYYSVDKNVFSQEFLYVLSNSDELVAYIDVPEENPFENRKVVVQNIFDKNVFYKEFQLEFSHVHTPVIDATFSKDGTALQLTYLSGEERTQTSTVLDLISTEYKVVLEDYKRILEQRFSDDFFEEYENGISINLSEDLGIHFSNMIVEMDSLLEETGTPKAFGYIIKDINKDSIDELFWVDKNHNILALFTIKDGQAELLDAFWPRYRAVLNDDNHLYIRSSGGADYTHWKIKGLASNSTKFVEIETFGTDGFDQSNNTIIYFHMIDNSQEKIDVNKFNALLQKYPFEHSEAWLNTTITFFE